MTGLKRPVVHPEAVEAYTEAEIARLLDTCRKGRTALRDRVIIQLLASTGMRVSELCSVTLDSIDLSEKVIAVTGKRRKPRIGPFDDDAYLAIRRYLRTS